MTAGIRYDGTGRERRNTPCMDGVTVIIPQVGRDEGVPGVG